MIDKSNKIQLKSIDKDKKVALIQANKNDKHHFINNDFAWVYDLEGKHISLQEWINHLTTLKISDGSLDEDFLISKINANKEAIDKLNNLVKNFKSEHDDLYSFRHKRALKKEQKNINNEVSNYLELLDDVVYNIKVDWNDAHNLDKQLNVYNIELQKANENNKVKSMLIEKPKTHNIDEIKNTQLIEWNSHLIQACKDDNNEFDAKAYTKYLKSISYNSVANIVSKNLDVALSIKGIINALKNLWEVISTKKISLLKTSLYSLLSSLQDDSENVKKLTKELSKNLIVYKNAADTELLSDLLAKINVDEVLTELENELNEYRIMFDMVLRKYAIASHIVRDLFINEVKAATNFDERNNKRRDNKNKYDLLDTDVLEIKNSSNLADYKYVESFRKSLYQSITKASSLKSILDKNAQVDEKLLNAYFHKLNVQAGILYDLNDLVRMLNLQFKKDQDKKVDLSQATNNILKDVVKFSYEQKLQIKKHVAFKLIYEVMLIHLRSLLMLQNDLDKLLSNSEQSWLVYFNKWIEFKKQYISKNKNSKKNNIDNSDHLVVITKNKKHHKHHHKVDNNVVASTQPTIVQPTKNPTKNEKLKVLKNKFSSSGVKIQEIVNSTKIDLKKLEEKESNK